MVIYIYELLFYHIIPIMLLPEALTMGKEMELHGQVIDGDFKGKNVYRWNDSSFIIVDGKIATGLFAPGYTKLQEISKDTVERYVEISSTSGNSHPNAAIIGILGVLSGTAIGTAQHDLAIYFKNGKKCVIRLFFDTCYNDLKRILFTL